jgi:hypothetical protein
MDDISALREYWSEVEASSQGAQDRARTALLARIAQTGGTAVTAVRARTGTGPRARFLPTWAWRTGIATVAAAALAAGLVVTVGPVGDGRNQASGLSGPPSTSSATSAAAGDAFELAAAFAAAQPFKQPRPDQWAYVELKIVIPDPSHGGAMSETLRRSWYRIDGTKIAIPNSSGRIEITTPQDDGRVGPGPALNPHDYPALARMPSDPQTLLTFLRAGLEPVADPSLDRSGSLFSLIGYILRENVLPPDVTAALLRAAALVPGVTQLPGTVTVDGHPAIAVGLVDRWAREDILLDPDTKEFLGSRSVAVADHLPVAQPNNQPLPAAQPTGAPRQATPGRTAKKGDVQYVITRGNCRIVDAPGQTS